MNSSSAGQGQLGSDIRAGDGVSSFSFRSAKQIPPVRFILAGLIALIAAGIILPAAVKADEPVLTESQLKAAFLVNFTKYVEWPEPIDEQHPIVIGVVNDDEVSREVEKLVGSKKSTAVQFRHIERAEDALRCRMVFIGGSDDRRTSDLLNRLRDQSVLTVGEADDFLDRGGVINFSRLDRKIRLNVNLSAARQSRLRISSKLLGVADRVKGR